MTKKERISYFAEHLINDLDDFEIRIMGINHYRIESRVNDRKVDYFPKTERAFLLNEQKWGTILIDDLIESLKTYLKTE